MVSPSRRLDAVKYLVSRHPVWERRAWRLIGQHRSTQRDVAQPPELERVLVARMNELAERHPAVCVSARVGDAARRRVRDQP